MYSFKNLYEPTDIKEACSILSEEKNTKIIAGGTDILLDARAGKLDGVSLMSLGKIDDLKKIEILKDGSLSIGSMTTFAMASKSPLVKERIAFFTEAATTMGGPQIQNMATLGGNLCNGATSADSAPSFLALDVKLTLVSIRGVREVEIEGFYKGLYQVDVEPDEILTSMKIPKWGKNWGGYYTKFSTRKAMDISTLGCAVVCSTKDKNTLDEVRITLGTAGPTPVRCYAAERLAAGMKMTDELIRQVGLEGLADAKPRTSWRASKKYREELIKVLVARTLKAAFVDAGGELS
jgi:xanthine dehydrogenase FAD-binding subunit